MVQASDDHATLTAPPTPPPTQDQAIKLSEIRCEVAVGTAKSAEMKVRETIHKTQHLVDEAQAAHEKAQADYDKAERSASRDESVEFGLRYAALKQEKRALDKREKQDNLYKLKYVSLSAKLPNLEKEIATSKNEHSILEAEIASLEKSVQANREELQVSQRKIKALKRQYPMKREMIDSQYAKPLISTNTEVSKLNLELSQGKRNEQKEQLLVMPLATSLKAVEVRVAVLGTEFAKKKAELRQVQTDTVEQARKNTGIEIGLSDELGGNRDKLLAERKNAAKGDASSGDTAEQESKIQGKKVKAEQQGEAEVEQQEQEDDKDSLSINLAQKEQEKLTVDLKKVTDLANVQQAADAEHYAKELAIIKATYAKKLEIEKQAHKRAKAKEPSAAESDDANDEREATELMEAKLNAAVPTLDP